MSYVITGGDEGIQVNDGVRLAIVGAGVAVPEFAEITTVLKQLLGEELRIAASAENSWIKSQFDLTSFEQADATMQQQVEALADKHGLLYAGFMPFADPQDLAHGIRGHMVRPRGIHIANKIMFTLAGGEQTYNLGCFQISAEWVHAVKPEVAKQALAVQVAHYQSISKQPLSILFETAGELDESLVAQNKAVLEKLGYQPAE